MGSLPRTVVSVGAWLFLATTLVGVLNAAPVLQLYIEGATYDPVTESWVAAPGGSSAGDPFRLWAIGNVSGPGGHGSIYKVRLAVSYASTLGDLDVTLTPSLAGGTGTYEGQSFGTVLPTAATLNNPVRSSNNPKLSDGTYSLVTFTADGDGVVNNGGSPVLGDNKTALPSHGEFGPGIYWKEFALGDFLRADATAPVADFINTFPTEWSNSGGVYKVYDISVQGAGGNTVHFDLYNHYYAGKRARYTFAPFSHDAHIVPEPTLGVALFGLLLPGVGIAMWRRRRHSA